MSEDETLKGIYAQQDSYNSLPTTRNPYGGGLGGSLQNVGPYADSASSLSSLLAMQRETQRMRSGISRHDYSGVYGAILCAIVDAAREDGVIVSLVQTEDFECGFPLLEISFKRPSEVETIELEFQDLVELFHNPEEFHQLIKVTCALLPKPLPKPKEDDEYAVALMRQMAMQSSQALAQQRALSAALVLQSAFAEEKKKEEERYRFMKRMEKLLK